jgi:hypothetical protein
VPLRGLREGVALAGSSTFLIRKLMKMRDCIYIRYTPERMCKYDVRFNGEICLGKVSIVIKLIGVDLY